MRQLVVQSRDTASDGSLAPLGTRAALLESLAQLNTGPDQPDGDVLYGPGLKLELPPSDPVTQMALTVVEEDIAWLVIERFARRFGWRFLDLESGRELALP